MDWVQRDISSYTVMVGGRRLGNKDQKWRYAVELFGDKDGKLPVGRAFFYEAAVPDDDNIHENIIYMYQPASVFPAVMDILRNERPLYLRYHRPGRHATLSTAAEIIGEGEM